MQGVEAEHPEEVGVCRYHCGERVLGVEERVEPLEEGHPVDEVEPEPRRGPEVVHDEVQVVRVPAERLVELYLCAGEWW